MVSVAMKAYNHAPFVAASIGSILDQSLEDFELVITDDGSTDGTPDIIASFRDPRIRFERFAENRGIAATMHATVQRARGEYIAIQNSDDVAFPSRLQRQVAYLEHHPDVVAVFCIPAEIGWDGMPVTASGVFSVPFPDGATPRRTDWLRHFFFSGNCLCAPSATIRRSALNELGHDDARLQLLGDLDRWIRLLSRHEIRVMPESLIAFRWHRYGGNASRPGRPTELRNAFESLQILRRYRELPTQLLRETFSSDVQQAGISTDAPTAVWLAEIALLGTQPWHRLFALETLFESAVTPQELRRLHELSGTLDLFGTRDTRSS